MTIPQFYLMDVDGKKIRDVTVEEIIGKFKEMYDHFIRIECDVCPANCGDGCIGDECAVYCLLTIEDYPIVEV